MPDPNPKKTSPKAEEILTDPKYADQKSFLKTMMKGLAKELHEEAQQENPEEETNLWDFMFGGKK